MNIKYCLPIVATKKEEILETLGKNYTRYSFFEIWLDYVSDLNIEFVQNIINRHGDKIIIVFRRQKLSNVHMSMGLRKEILKVLGKQSMVDLDITQQEELSYVKDNNLSLKLIASYHNYEMTPNKEELEEIITLMKVYNPAMYKIATYCQREDDALRLLCLLLQLKEEGIRCIMLGMGTHGAITRIFGTLWGNEMIFAPLDAKDQTAPGMLTKKQLDNIFKKLNYK